jgi:predicted hydrocarbon binding protein
MTTVTLDRAIPNRRFHCLLLAVQDVMGRNGLNATLKVARLPQYLSHLPPDNGACESHASEYAAIIQAIETQLGSSARGQLNRIGHASFKHVVASDRFAWNTQLLTRHLLPVRQRLQRALAQLARYLSEPDSSVGVLADHHRLLFVDESSDATYGRQSNAEICWFTLGQIQECIHWATGHSYEVVEVACKARGHPGCKFEVGQPFS